MDAARMAFYRGSAQRHGSMGLAGLIPEACSGKAVWAWLGSSLNLIRKASRRRRVRRCDNNAPTMRHERSNGSTTGRNTVGRGGPAPPASASEQVKNNKQLSIVVSIV